MEGLMVIKEEGKIYNVRQLGSIAAVQYTFKQDNLGSNPFVSELNGVVISVRYDAEERLIFYIHTLDIVCM